MIKITKSTKGLEDLKGKLSVMAAETEVSFLDVMNPGFVSSHSKFADFTELCRAAGFGGGSQEEFEAIPDDQWNDFVKTNTDFGGWDEMQKQAMGAYIKQRLNS